jgi:predicted alpha/beta-fold hydrolase
MTMADLFRPLPLLGNPHVQTVLGNLLPGPRMHFASRLRAVPLEDGDHLAVHDTLPPRWRPDDPVTILVHGLGGSHRSGYMVRLANALAGRGTRVVRIDLRGAGAGAGWSRRLYHAGCSADLRAVVRAVNRWTPASSLRLAGFSLGGNIVLKLAGEAAGDPLPGLDRIAAVAPPIDLEASSYLIAMRRNRLYENYYVRGLLRQVARHQRVFTDVPRVRFPRRTTLRLFDDLYTAPRGGFADALDYYRRASALPLLDRIEVRTLVLSARDDPFVPIEPFERIRRPATMEVRVASGGGHLGFLGFDGAGGIRWAERRVFDWLLSS